MARFPRRQFCDTRTRRVCKIGCPSPTLNKPSQSQITQYIEDLHSSDDPPGVWLLRDHVEFGKVNGAKGLKRILFPEEADSARRLQRRYRPTKEPQIQILLKRAFELKVQLDKTKGLTRDALAKKNGLNPSYLTRILNLLNLAPLIQQHILAMPAEITRSTITECRIKHIARMRDHQAQLEAFRKLLVMPARVNKIPALTAS